MKQRASTTGHPARWWRGLAAVLAAMSLLMALLGANARPAGAVASQAVASQAFGWGDSGWCQVSSCTYGLGFPVPINGATGFTQVKSVAAGKRRSLAVTNDGNVWSWGNDWYGELGRGVTGGAPSSTPKPVVTTPGGSVQFGGAASVAAGDDHSLALMNDKTVWAWGYNSSGRLGNGVEPDSNVPVQVLTAPGTPLSNVIAISAGQVHSLALTATGAVYAWGNNGNGQLGINPSVVGQSYYATLVPGLVNISTATGATIVAGGLHNLAVSTGGNVYAWGDNNFGKLGNNTTDQRVVYAPTLVKAPDGVADLSGITSVGAGGNHSLAVGPGGSVYGWGYNYYGQTGTGSVQQPVVGTPVQVASLSGVATVAGGQNHSVALKSDGTVWAWGNGQYGGIGNDTAAQYQNFAPLQVKGPGNTGYLGGVTAIAANNHNLVVVSPRAKLSAASLTYGKQVAGTTSPSRTVTLTNTGSIAMSVSASTTGDFTQTNDCGTSLAPNATCTFTVTFAPTAVGALTGSLDIANDSPRNPHAVALRGEGTAPLVLSSMTPISGSTNGGTNVTISGSGIQANATVKIGGVTCTAPSVGRGGGNVSCTTGLHAAGTVDVVVTNPDDGQVTTMVGAYTYVLPPTVNGINPDSGPTAGGATVAIAGSDFQIGARVYFGANEAASVTRQSAGLLTATAPPGAVGPVNVAVTNPDAQSATAPVQYTYIAPPTVTSVNPTSGPMAGGARVTIGGSNFVSGATVRIGSAPATNVTYVSAAQLTATTPPGAAGLANVVVTNPDGQPSTQTVNYTYVAPPTVRSIDPASGPTAGGQTVTITGADFQNGATVSIGGSDCAVAGQAFVVVPAPGTSITCTTGAHGWGPANVVVTNPDGQFSTDAVSYTYVAPAPAIGGVSPTSGPSAGGTTVTVSGSNFMNGATVKFGGMAATGVTFDHSGQLRATAPGHGAGTVDVVVTNPDGQAVTKGGAYTYVAPPAPAPAPPPPPASVPAPVPAPAPAAGPGSSYSGWQSRGGQLVGHAPTLVSFQGRLYAVVVGNGNQVYLSSAPDGTSFGAWQPVGGDASVAWQSAGGIATSAPAAAVHDGALHLFVRGADNALYTSQSVDGMTFLPWRSLGGVLTTAPAATSFNGRLLVYAGGLDRAVYLTSSVDGLSFSGWRSLGGQLPGNSLDPVAVTATQGMLLVYARGTDNQLYVMTSGSGVYYSAWWSLGGVLSRGPAAATAGGTTAVFVRGADGRLYETRASDGVNYSNWRNLGGVLVSAPAATSFNGQVHVATQGADGRLYTQSTQP